MYYKCIILILLLFFGAANLCSSTFTYEQALTKFYELNLQSPKPDADGRVQTLNKKGAASASFDYAMRKFLEFGKDKNILEIGGCYGDVMLQALKQSEKTKYTLSDLDDRHIFIAAKGLFDKIQQDWLAQNSADQVKFVQADISKSTEVHEIGEYDAIYVGKVLHFLTPAQFDLAIKHLFLLLNPKGRVYITALSPYLKHFENFIPEFERRIKAKEKNPGFIPRLRDYISISDRTPPQIMNMIDDTFLFLDPQIMREAFENHGFHVIECRFAPLTHKSKLWAHDNREYVILIAEKVA